MDDDFKGIRRGLEEVARLLGGEDTGAEVHIPDGSGGMRQVSIEKFHEKLSKRFPKVLRKLGE